MTNKQLQQKFSEIYLSHSWEGKSRSGPGSDLENAKFYLDVLARFIKEPKNSIHSVVDIGCGDWSLAKDINWEGINYLGIDIVPELIVDLNETYACENINFINADLVHDELPTADLIIVKDVLQHLSNKSVEVFLTKLNSYRFAIITNDIRKVFTKKWTFGLIKTPLAQPNTDIEDGGSRPLKLIEAPFNLNARRLGHYKVLVGETIYFKEILLWEKRC